MNQELIEAMCRQADVVRQGMVAQLTEMFPPEDGSDVELVTTGFVFRPASSDDWEDGEPEEDGIFIFEVHFNALQHPMIGNLSSKTHLVLHGCETYTQGAHKFVDIVERACADDPGCEGNGGEHALGVG